MEQQELIPRKRTDMLTIKIQVLDRDKIAWLWDLFKGNPEDSLAQEKGMAIWAMAWGDTDGEKAYVLDRIDRFMQFGEREEMFDEIRTDLDPDGEEPHLDDDLETLEWLIEKWSKEAQEIFGSQSDHETVVRHYEAERRKEKLRQEARERSRAHQAAARARDVTPPPSEGG